MAVERVTPYGLKEVADCYLYPANTVITINSGAGATDFATIVSAGTDPKFIFDTLKVTNIEVSAEDASATGGRGNAELLNWSYGKEITFTMEDAVFSLATLDLMFGAKNKSGGGVDDPDNTTIIVDADTFPSNYHVVGLTYIRNKNSGVDIPFVFEIPNAKVNVGGTLTMEADGDPSTFEMTMKAMKAKDGSLVKFHRIGDGDNAAAAAHYSDNVQTKQ